ncbi:hypothetical protein EV356DRAFT_578463 [Viridothelium virens]|uniref:Protein kinase domain-containing protein n=1 Tax=Viridothelium virens TaxID=1048519 RepID=A0A6A6H3H7_VIRVR|nr:hypothetical protein EV356DRAFT_578463 [Viridothelium virens]
MATGLDVAASIGGLLSLAFQTFHGCVKAYQVFYRAQSLGNDGEIICSRLRWEQFRTEDWAKRAELADSPLETVNWFIALDVLKELEVILTKTDVLKTKYSLTVEEDANSDRNVVAPAKGLGKFIARLSPDSISTSSQAILSKNSKLNRFKWAITDREKAGLLTRHISELNHRLLILLDSAERKSVEVAISSLLRDYISQSTSLGEIQEAQQLLNPDISKKDDVLAQVARLKSIRLCTGADKREDEEQPSATRGDPPSWMPRLKRLNRKKFETIPRGSSSPYRRLELARYDGRQVVVEWKNAQGSLWGEVQDQVKRLCLLLSSLQDTASKLNPFHCLDCIGYLPWEEKGRYGLLYALPQNIIAVDSMHWSYRCLRCLLSEMKRLPLDDRFRIGLELAQTILQLHTAGWLHKGIRSENLFFFAPSETLNLNKVVRGSMYLLGYDYARSDDKEGAALTQYVNSPARTQIYKHPEYRGRDRQPFRKQFDMYGLGCVLLELAHWSPLIEIYPTLFTKQIGDHITDADKHNKEIELPLLNGLAAKYPDVLPHTSHKAGGILAGNH